MDKLFLNYGGDLTQTETSLTSSLISKGFFKI
jgi:hypothetical protein